MKFVWRPLLVSCLAAVAVNASRGQEPPAQEFTLHPLPPTTASHRCSCRFWLQTSAPPTADQSPVFVSGWLPDEKLASIHLDAEVVSLKLVRAEDPAEWTPGAEAERLYWSDSVMLRAVFKSTGDCGPASACEGVPVGGKLLVRSEHAARAFDVVGRCACPPAAP